MQIRGKKLEMPEAINRDMDAQARALTFYTTVRKSGQHKRVLSPSAIIGHLADVCNLASINDNNIEVLTEDYNAQLFVPGNFHVVSFHNEAGQVVNTTTAHGGFGCTIRSVPLRWLAIGFRVFDNFFLQ